MLPCPPTLPTHDPRTPPQQVSTRSHAYLQPAFADWGPAAFTTNVSARADDAVAAQRTQQQEEQQGEGGGEGEEGGDGEGGQEQSPPFYAPLIERYLGPWREAGITKASAARAGRGWGGVGVLAPEGSPPPPLYRPPP